ncbi:hypothetical protein PR048_004351 [Dryococelus australis]|uniref:Seipin n=1 Tax=Dryococelus australis TaxID=614101 RepID=A0ABQ9I571_9NEOP|nr:hypothetical protein PR048_004351 [Dryococelus australis]
MAIPVAKMQHVLNISILLQIPTNFSGPDDEVWLKMSPVVTYTGPCGPKESGSKSRSLRSGHSHTFNPTICDDATPENGHAGFGDWPQHPASHPKVPFIRRRIQQYKRTTSSGVQNLRELLFNSGIVALIASVIVWLAVFLYVAFYYTYMPTMSHIRPVHLQFKIHWTGQHPRERKRRRETWCDKCGHMYSSKNGYKNTAFVTRVGGGGFTPRPVVGLVGRKSCEAVKGVCSYPSAHVELTKKQQLLMVGQSYKMILNLDMPESPANKDLGMFMVCAELRDKDGTLVERSCRSAMLRYRSTLLHVLSAFMFSPMYLFGSKEEKQKIVLELFSDFREDQSTCTGIPKTDVADVATKCLTSISGATPTPKCCVPWLVRNSIQVYNMSQEKLKQKYKLTHANRLCLRTLQATSPHQRADKISGQVMNSGRSTITCRSEGLHELDSLGRKDD